MQRTDSVHDLFHVQVGVAASERVHNGVGAAGWHMARQLRRSLLADVASGFEFFLLAGRVYVQLSANASR